MTSTRKGLPPENKKATAKLSHQFPKASNGRIPAKFKENLTLRTARMDTHGLQAVWKSYYMIVPPVNIVLNELDSRAGVAPCIETNTLVDRLGQ